MSIFDLLFPRNCLNCKKIGNYICKSCIQKVSRVKLVCAYCKKSSIEGLTHATCRRKYGLDGMVSVWRYQGVVRKALLGLKYKFASDISKNLAGVTSEYLKDNKYMFSKDCILIPIPLHRLRRNWRGFNQAEEIGKRLSEVMGWKYRNNILFRTKHNTPQTELKKIKRKSNVKGVFQTDPKYNFKNTKYKILVFDDVYTTGSTIKEAVKVLKKAGAHNVWGLTVAR